MKNPTLNKIYSITYYDHFSTENKSSEKAINDKDTMLTVYGKCVGYNDKYIVLSFNFEDLSSDNNDNMHIFRPAIKQIKELK